MQISSTMLQRGVAHVSASRAGSGKGTRGESSVSDGSYRASVLTRQRISWLPPIVDIHHLNRRVKKLKFKMLTLKQIVAQILSEDWLKRRILPCLHPPSAQEVPEVFFWGQRIPIPSASGCFIPWLSVSFMVLWGWGLQLEHGFWLGTWI